MTGKPVCCYHPDPCIGSIQLPSFLPVKQVATDTAQGAKGIRMIEHREIDLAGSFRIVRDCIQACFDLFIHRQKKPGFSQDAGERIDIIGDDLTAKQCCLQWCCAPAGKGIIDSLSRFSQETYEKPGELRFEAGTV
jgi:hypothetical protein